MSNNVVSLPFDDLAECEDTNGVNILSFMGEINEFCDENGVDTSTLEYKHQAAVIMTQLQIILMGAK